MATPSRKQLVSYVHVSDPEHGAVVFGPGDAVPAWAVKHITNPKAWGEEPAASSSVEKPREK